MSWNNFPHPPPPPPPGAGAHPPRPPPPYSNSPFWDIINSFGPNSRPTGGVGYGVDHAEFPHGFTIGPTGFNAWSGRRGFEGNWGGRGGWAGHRGGHGRRGYCHHYCDEGSSSGGSGDEEMRDANAAATPATESPQDGGETGRDPEKADMRDEAGGEHPDPPEEVPTSPHRHRHGRCGGSRRGGHRRGGSRHGHRGGPPHHGGGPGGGSGGFSFPFPLGGGGGPRCGWEGGGGAFDFNAMMNALADHPFARGLREHWAGQQAHRQQRHARAQAAAGDGEQVASRENEEEVDSETFVPPVDIFNSAGHWTLHVAVPGAKKEDVKVNWDADRSTLGISGLVYRPGGEEFLNTLVSGERRVGLFERKMQLPPFGGASRDAEGEKEEVDADHVTARMEDGILIVVVPKVEKEWTEVKKVDIQ